MKYTRRLRLKICITMLIGLQFVPVDSFAQSSTDYFNFIRTTCSNLDPEPDWCTNATAGAGGGGAILPRTGNIGVLSAQGRAANNLAYQQRKGIRRRLDELEDSTEDKGGGASADFSSGNFGTFLTLQHAEMDRQATLLENGFLSELNGIFGGVDYRFRDNLVAGISVGFSQTNANFNDQAGSLDTESINTSAYAAFNPSENTIIDGYFGYASLNYDSQRKVNMGLINDTAKGSTAGDQYLSGISASYGWQYSSWNISPQFKLDYSNTHVQSYTETGSQLSSIYGNQNIRSLKTSLGGNITYALSVPWGVLLPQVRAFYVHEFKDPSRELAISIAALPTAGFTTPTDKPDRDYFIWGGGLSTVMAQGVQMFVDYEQLSGNYLYNIWTISAGLRSEF